MSLKKVRWSVAAAVAFLIGIPMVEKAQAQGVDDIANGIFSLINGIVDLAGNS